MDSDGAGVLMIRPTRYCYPSVKVITPPTSEQITLEYARLQLSLQPNDDSPPSHPLDPAILKAIPYAREECETFMRRALAPQTCQLSLDAFYNPCKQASTAAIELPRPPVTAIESVIYVDADGEPQTMDDSLYFLDDGEDNGPAWLLPAYGTTWPSTRSQANAVKIRCLCGFSISGDSPETNPLPELYLQAMVVMMIGAVHGRGDPSKLDQARTAMESMLQLHRLDMGT